MQDKKKWFSVIVPVYNVEQYLKSCLDSIIEQDFDDYELIIVDDGSTDNSSVVCDKYASKYSIVRVIHQKNRGLSAARNTGLRVATGKYILFVDSDDYIAQGTLRKFFDVTCQNPVDLVAAYGYKIISNGNCVERGYFRNGFDGVISGREYYARTLYEDCYSAASVYNLTKLTVIRDNHLQFQEGLLHEDELWTPKLLCCCDSVLDLKFRFYYYRMTNPTSITRNPSAGKKRALSRIDVSHALKRNYDEDSKCHIPAMMDNAAAQYMYGVYAGELLEEKDFVLERKFSLQCAKSFKYKLKAFIFYISPRTACWLRRGKEKMESKG